MGGVSSRDERVGVTKAISGLGLDLIIDFDVDGTGGRTEFFRPRYGPNFDVNSAYLSFTKDLI